MVRKAKRKNKKYKQKLANGPLVGKNSKALESGVSTVSKVSPVRLNILLVFIAALLYVITSLIYGETHSSELIKIREKLKPMLIIIVTVSMLVTMGFRLSLNHSKVTVEKFYKWFLIIKTPLTIIVITVMMYPAAKLSGASDFVVSQMFGMSNVVGKFHQYYVEASAWFLSGIVGWIGAIVLGALGSGLWQFINNRSKVDKNA